MQVSPAPELDDTHTVQLEKKTTAVRDNTVPAAKVVVVGGGLAGLCASLEAAEAGAIVVLLEKEKGIGGNSAKATSGINGFNTTPQVKQGIDDSADLFRGDSLKSGGGLSDEPLIDTLVAHARESVEWLRDSFGLDLSQICQCGGHSRPRTHRMPPSEGGRPVPVGWTTVSTLRKRLEAFENASIITGAKVSRILSETTSWQGEPGVAGVEYELVTPDEGMGDNSGGDHKPEVVTLLSDAVVLTTGGYAYERGEGSLLREFGAESLWPLPTTSGKQADGAGITIARRDVDANLTHMDQVQVHPTGLVNPADPNNPSKMLAPEAMRGSGGVLLTGNGHRFCNELNTRANVTAAIFASCGPAAGSDSKVAFLVMNEEAAAAFGAPSLAFYKSKGLVKSGKGATELAGLVGCDEAHLVETLTAYGAAAAAAESGMESQEDGHDAYGKTVFPSKDWRLDQEFHVSAVTPCIHYTMGGLSISSSAEVLRLRKEDGVLASVLGLFAAGEVTGGVHGANRLAGNSLLECVVFGRIAGRRAAQITQDVLPALDPKEYTPVRLRHKKCLSKKGSIFELSFELPSSRHTVYPWMLAGQYISVRSMLEGKPVERFYSPITRDKYYGKVDLLIKCSPEGGPMQKFFYDLEPGSVLEMRGPMGGLDFKLGDGEFDKIGLIAGGIGISPMVQIIRETIYEKLPAKLHLLWGVEYEEDIIYREIMDKMAKLHGELEVTYVVNHPEEAWQGEKGFVDKEVIKRNLFPPGDGVKIVVCGPWKMCQVMKGVLKDAGYADKMIFSFM